jgi:hypothetical protein
MGSKALARQSQANAQRAADAAAQGQSQEQAIERQRADLENYLGSDGAAPPIVEGFDTYYTFTSVGSKKGQARMMGANVQRWNTEMQRAYDLAAAGNMEEANQIKAGIESEYAAYQQSMTGKAGDKAAKRFGTIGTSTFDRNTAGRAARSPLAQSMSDLVKDSRALMDPESDTSRRFKDALTAGALAETDAAQLSAERTIATQERTSRRQLRDAQLGGTVKGGLVSALALRNSERFAAMNAEVASEAGARRAQIYGEAARFYEQFKREWATNTVAAAQAYLANASGFRDNYRMMQIDLVKTIAGVWSNQSSNSASMASAFRQAEATEARAKSAMIGSIASSAMSAAGGFMKCWVADELFGVNDVKTFFARYWCQHNPRNPFVRLYGRFGRGWADFLRAHPWAKPLVAPVWELMAVLGAHEWAGEIAGGRAR